MDSVYRLALLCLALFYFFSIKWLSAKSKHKHSHMDFQSTTQSERGWVSHMLQSLHQIPVFHGGTVCIELSNTYGKAQGTSRLTAVYGHSLCLKARGWMQHLYNSSSLADPPNYRQGSSWIVLTKSIAGCKQLEK